MASEQGHMCTVCDKYKRATTCWSIYMAHMSLDNKTIIKLIITYLGNSSSSKNPSLVMPNSAPICVLQ